MKKAIACMLVFFLFFGCIDLRSDNQRFCDSAESILEQELAVKLISTEDSDVISARDEFVRGVEERPAVITQRTCNYHMRGAGQIVLMYTLYAPSYEHEINQSLKDIIASNYQVSGADYLLLKNSFLMDAYVYDGNSVVNMLSEIPDNNRFSDSSVINALRAVKQLAESEEN